MMRAAVAGRRMALAGETDFSLPGITGLAQISGRSDRSFRLDARIIARTVSLILRRDGAF